MRKCKFIFIFLMIMSLGILCSCSGEQGPVGPQGEQGIQGEKGDTGAPGKPGKDGVDGEDGHTPVITIGANWNWFIDGIDTGVSAKGDKGDTGKQGVQGEVGPQGEQGVQGEVGPQGEQGLSAYEIFLKYYPYYEGSEEDWITDVAMGNKCNLFGHEWDDGVVTTEPTKGNEGEKTYSCVNCDEHKYEVLPKIEVASAEIYEIDGVKYVNYGSYPQTHVWDETLISELNKLTTTNASGYYEYAGKEYAKVTTKPYQSGSYTDDYGNTQYYTYNDGKTVNRNVIEWFIVEPIQWRIISENTDGSYQLHSEYILDATCYCDYDYLRSIDDIDIFQNNYKYSNIRAWLNGYNGTDYKITDYTNKGFYDIAFENSEKGAIITTEVDNSASTTNPPSMQYACENTFDKMYLLSYKDMYNSNYGYTDTIFRYAQVTDYAKAVGAYWNTSTEYLNNGYHWLRSPFYNNDDASYVHYNGNVYQGGSYYYGNPEVALTYYGVRIACTINLEENE